MVVKGKKLTLKEHWQKLKDELAPMTPKQRWEHLWEYYRWVLGVLALVIAVVEIIATGIINSNTEVLVSGVLLNMEPAEEGYIYLTDDYYNAHRTEGARQRVDLATRVYDSSENAEDPAYNYDVLQSIMAMIYAQDLDYIIADHSGMMQLLGPDFILDLREIFTEEELAAMDGRVIKLVVEETGETIPMAIDISDSEFCKAYNERTQIQYYMMFSITTPRPEVCREMYERIMVLEDSVSK